MENNLNDTNFDSKIMGDKPVLVDFFASWCEPCMVLGPILEKVAEELKDKVVLIKANVDEIPLTSQKFKIDRIPNVILFKNGKPVEGFIGVRLERDIKAWLEKLI